MPFGLPAKLCHILDHIGSYIWKKKRRTWNIFGNGKLIICMEKESNTKSRLPAFSELVKLTTTPGRAYTSSNLFSKVCDMSAILTTAWTSQLQGKMFIRLWAEKTRQMRLLFKTYRKMKTVWLKLTYRTTLLKKEKALRLSTYRGKVGSVKRAQGVMNSALRTINNTQVFERMYLYDRLKKSLNVS